MINFLNMKYFLVVAEARSFSAAAKQLYISQQTLSAHIAQIEEEIGTQLFEMRARRWRRPRRPEFWKRSQQR